MYAVVRFKSQFCAQISQLWNDVPPLPLHQIIPDIGERPYFHLLLCIACLGSHVREKCGIWEFKEPWVDCGLVRIYVQSNRTQLPAMSRTKT